MLLRDADADLARKISASVCSRASWIVGSSSWLQSVMRSVCPSQNRRQGHIQRTQMENSEPAAFASPIGSSVCGNSRDVRYAPGMRTQTIDRKICRNDSPDRPQAQK